MCCNCKWDVDDNECEPDDNVVENENIATCICINLTAIECLDNLVCDNMMMENEKVAIPISINDANATLVSLVLIAE
eukprot:Awhi_evm1s10860